MSDPKHAETQRGTPRPWLRRSSAIAVSLAALALVGVVWTSGGARTRLFCDRCAAVCDTRRVTILGMNFGNESTRSTALSRWIEAETGPCTHHWTPGYTDGLWTRSCHYGNPANFYLVWGDDEELLAALRQRQAEDPTFVTRVVESLPQNDPESAGFLLSMMFDNAGTRLESP